MFRSFLILILLLSVVGCTSIPPEQRDQVRADIDADAAQTVERVVQAWPDSAAAIECSEGYFAINLAAANVLIAGAGHGTGVLVDQGRAVRTYLNATRAEIGAGIGLNKTAILIVFKDREALESFGRGQWLPSLGAEGLAGTAGSSVASSFTSIEADVYALGDRGARVAATARMSRIRVNTDLTDVGLSDISIPAKRPEKGEQAIEEAPREWGRALPFLAQKVLNEGYDLPLPYGVGLTYADVEQDQLLTNLEVGFNGSPKELFEWVSFDQAVSKSKTASLKADAWLFPFMNVFAMIGQTEGDAMMDIYLEGNGMLDQIGEDCSRPGPKPLCSLLEDRIFLLPIDTSFSGKTYGLGTTLAVGWRNFFFTLPLNATYADMDNTRTNGLSYTATPRLGYLSGTGRYGTLALFVGGNYLNVELEIDGDFAVPGTDLVINYSVDQKNADNWNALVGFNWDLDKRWSLSAEYNGFIGSREAFIGSLNWRF